MDRFGEIVEADAGTEDDADTDNGGYPSADTNPDSYVEDCGYPSADRLAISVC